MKSLKQWGLQEKTPQRVFEQPKFCVVNFEDGKYVRCVLKIHKFSILAKVFACVNKFECSYQVLL